MLIKEEVANKMEEGDGKYKHIKDSFWMHGTTGVIGLKSGKDEEGST